MANELYHHGIKGQKWGERRFQNPDGTLTEEGKKRYYKESTGDKIAKGVAVGYGLTKVGSAVANTINSNRYAIREYVDSLENGFRTARDVLLLSGSTKNASTLASQASTVALGISSVSKALSGSLGLQLIKDLVAPMQVIGMGLTAYNVGKGVYNMIKNIPDDEPRGKTKKFKEKKKTRR